MEFSLHVRTGTMDVNEVMARNSSGGPHPLLGVQVARLPVLGRIGTRAKPSTLRKVFLEDVFSTGLDGFLDAEELQASQHCRVELSQVKLSN